MPTPETPKYSGSHRRWGRPFGEFSKYYSIFAVILVLCALALFLGVLIRMSGSA